LSGAIQSSIPIGAGLSSSAAIEVAAATAWLTAADHKVDSMQVAKLCQRAENEFVGVDSGLMDQWTVTHSRREHALLLDFAQGTWERLKLPATISLVIAYSGLQRSLSDSAYSQRVQECQQVLRVLQKNHPDLQHLGQATMEQLEQARTELSQILYRRGRHVISEVGRVRQAVEHLTSGNAGAIGPLLIESHISLRDDYQVSSDELDLLVELAVGLPGCYGARLTGAGFGGCTINWVEKGEAEEFRSRLVSDYQEQSGIETEAWICRAVGAARWQELVN
jgi:galactokinase